MFPSLKTREATKTALAMIITYGIALQMGWEKPMWAGLSVILVSLATMGQSLNVACMRMFGTLVGALAGLIILALSTQDRWLFMLLLSVYVGFCTYMMAGPKRQSFWHVCGFVCVIICMSAGPAGPESVSAFETAVLRSQETGLGILAYSLVAILLWPSTSQRKFETVAEQRIKIQHQLFQAYLAEMNGADRPKELPSLKTQEIQGQRQFNQLLDAAETDSDEVREQRRAWRRFQAETGRLTETLEEWREGFAGLQGLDLQQLIPSLADFIRELDQQWVGMEKMFKRQEPEQPPPTVNLSADATALKTSSHFQKAALAALRTRLQTIESQTRALFECVREIRNFSPAGNGSAAVPPRKALVTLDSDRLASVLQIMAMMWLAYLSLLYVNGLPGGSGLLSLATALGMVTASSPHIPIPMMFKPVALSMLFGSFVYLLVMPHLSSFLGLGCLLFAVTFAICYLFATPRQALGRTFGLAMFVSIASVSNQQNYSVLVVTTTALMWSLMFLFLIVASYVPFSPRPQRAFMRLVHRFFRSCHFIMMNSHLDTQPTQSRLEGMKWAFHTHEVSTLPRKLAVWGRFINPKILPGTSPSSVQALTTHLEALSARVQAWLEERNRPQTQELLAGMITDVHAWQNKVSETLQALSSDPAATQSEPLREGLSKIMERLETLLNEADLGQYSDEAEENFYRLLGAFRGVSEALIQYTGSAGAIDWQQWQEERF